MAADWRGMLDDRISHDAPVQSEPEFFPQFAPGTLLASDGGRPTTSLKSSCRGRFLAGSGRWRGFIKRDIPGIVAIEPGGIVITAAHPGVGARNLLNPGSARLAMSFETLERRLDSFDRNVLQTARQHRGVLDRGGGTLRHVWGHRMTGVADQNYPALAPGWQGITLQDRPFVAVGAGIEHHPHLGMETGIGLSQLVHVALGRPRLPRHPVGWFRNAGDEVKLAAVPGRVIDHDVAIFAPPFGARAGDFSRQEAGAENGTVGDAAAMYRLVGPDDDLAHHRVNAVGADHGIGFGRRGV